MAIWLVRAGRHGEQEDAALENGIVVIGWEELPDLSKVKTREELAHLMNDTYPNERPNTLTNWTGQIWAFRERIKANDLVVLPLKTRSAIAIGQVTGPYEYDPTGQQGGWCHTRKVIWLRTDFPRSVSIFGQDLLHSFGAFLTVCQIQRNNAEKRITTIVQRKHIPRSRSLASVKRTQRLPS
jgi:restriction system protein